MIQELRERIIKANEDYRLGKPSISDVKYDTLIEELLLLDPDDDLLTKVGIVVSDDRKSRLPIEMASMNKIKSMEDINDWCRLKSISKDEYVILTPKFDGLSLCVDENTQSAWTRGDGTLGQRSNEHYKLIQNHLKQGVYDFSYGEIMMPKKIFIDKYSEDFANPRNLVAGLMNSKDATDSLRDCHYITYGAITKSKFNTKQEILASLNSNKDGYEVYTYRCRINDLSEELLIDLFHH
jgi:NAD-dependent DNA ligase